MPVAMLATLGSIRQHEASIVCGLTRVFECQLNLSEKQEWD